jgi:hypothetical protein
MLRKPVLRGLAVVQRDNKNIMQITETPVEQLIVERVSKAKPASMDAPKV